MEDDAPGFAALVRDKAERDKRIAQLEALLRRIDAVITWETTPLGRAFQDELEATLRRTYDTDSVALDR